MMMTSSMTLTNFLKRGVGNYPPFLHFKKIKILNMQYINKKFTDLRSNQVVKVIDQFEDILIFDDKRKVKANELLNSNVYQEYIDPEEFFRRDTIVNPFRILADKIRNSTEQKNLERSTEFENNIGTNTTVGHEDITIPYDEEEEKRILIEKAKKIFEKNAQEEARKQRTKIENIMRDRNDMLQEDPMSMGQESNLSFSNDLNNIQKLSNDNRFMRTEEDNSNGTFVATKITSSDDPIIQMFRNVKRNTDLNFTIKLSNKIPRLDFIEMMEDSYNTSIIDFLAEEFTNTILQNPDRIKDKIMNEIKSLVKDNMEKKEMERSSKSVVEPTKEPKRSVSHRTKKEPVAQAQL